MNTNPIEAELCHHLLGVALSGTILTVGAWAITAAWRRASAGQRHAVWLAALAAMAAAPALEALAPEWSAAGWLRSAAAEASFPDVVHVARLSQSAEAAISAAPAFASRDAARSYPCIAVVTVISLGVLWRLGMLACSARSLSRLRRGASPVSDSLRRRSGAARLSLPVMLSRHVPTPALAGWRRPVILLPAGAESWSGARLKAAIEHECAHFERGDHWQLPLLELLRAAYWWHPAVWFALHRLRREREQACDDLAIERGGIRPSDYADALLAAGRAAAASRHRLACGLTLALALARRGGIARRVEAALDSRRRTAPASRTLRIGSAAAAIAGAACLAGFSLSAPAEEPDPGAGPLIKLSITIVEVPEDDYFRNKARYEKAVRDGDAAWLTRREGAHCAMPQIVTRSGQRCRIEVIREFLFPAALDRSAEGILVPSEFETRNLGITVDLHPVLEDQQVRIHGSMRIVTFEGYSKDGEEERPLNAPTFLTKEGRILRMIPLGSAEGYWLPGSRTSRSDGADPPLDAPDDVDAPRMAQRTAMIIRAELAGTPTSEHGSQEKESADSTDPAPPPGDAIILPKFELSDVSVAEAVRQLEEAAREHDPAGEDIRVKVAGGFGDRLLTLSLSDVPVREAVEYIAQLAGGEVAQIADHLVIRPKASAPDESPDAAPQAAPGQDIVLPKVEFDQVTIPAAAGWIAAESRIRDPNGHGVDVDVQMDPDLADERKITLSLTKVTVRDALGYIATLGGMKLTVSEGRFLLATER